MALFRLLEGQHIQYDPDWEPSEEDKEMAKSAGTPLKPPSRLYVKGQMVENDSDLVARFGAQKFALVSGQPNRGLKATRGTQTAGDVSELNEQASPAVFPGGQVSTGFQSTTGTGVLGNREHVSGPLQDTPDERARRAAAQGKSATPPVDDGEDEEEPTAPKTRGKSPSDADLNSMTVEELREHAADEEINLHGASTKSDIVKAIKKEQKR
jgi:hypothetical protein